MMTPVVYAVPLALMVVVYDHESNNLVKQRTTNHYSYKHWRQTLRDH